MFRVALAVVMVAGWTFGAMEAAAENSRGWVEVKGGVEATGSRDEMGSPRVYRGMGVPLVVAGALSRGPWQWGLEAGGFGTGFNGGPLQARGGGEDHGVAEQIFVDGSLWGTRRVWQGRRLGVDAGARLSHWTFFRSYSYHSSQIGAVETWESPTTIDGLGRVRVSPISRVHLQAELSVPLMGRVLRPNYAVRGDERMALVERRTRVLSSGRWATWPTLQMVQARGAVHLETVGPLMVVAEWRVGGLALNGEVPTRATAQRLVVGVRLSL